MESLLEFVRQHIEAWDSRDSEMIAEAIAFPFVQFDHDGSVHIANRPEELFDFAAIDQYSTSLASAEIVQSGPTVHVVKLSFNWEYPDQAFSGVGNAVWGLEKIDGGFNLRWWQFLGWETEARSNEQN